MKFYNLIFVLVFLTEGCSFNETNKASSDSSYEKLYRTADDNSLSLNVRLEAIARAEKTILEVHDTLQINRLFEVADLYWQLNSYNLYLETVEVGLEKSLKFKDTVSIIKSYIYLGDYYNGLYKDDSAYYHYIKAEKIAISFGENGRLFSHIQLKKGQIEYNIGNYWDAENSAIEVLRRQGENHSRYVELGAHNLLGNIYCDLQSYDASIAHHKIALDIYSERKNANKFRAVSYFNLGLVYQQRQMYDSAQYYYKLASATKNLRQDNPSLYANILDNYGYSQVKVGNLDGLQLLLKGLALNQSLNYEQRIINSLIHLSEYYYQVADDSCAKYYAEQALETSLRSLDHRNQLVSLQHLISADPTNASPYAEQYIKISDSLLLAERKARNKFARIEYETDELVLEKEQVIKEKRISLISATSLILLISFMFLLYRQKMRQRQLYFKQAQQETNEEIYRLLLVQQNKVHEGRQYEKHRISRDLHDGIMNRLTSTRLNLFAMTQSDDPQTLQNCRKYIEELKAIENEVRDISHDLSKDIALGHDSYTIIIENLVNLQKVESNTIFQLTLDNRIDWDRFDSKIKINIYRILQECLQNINIHAQARVVRVSFALVSNRLDIEVADDGIGFAVKRSKLGVGLKNILSRAEQIGAAIDIKSEIGDGTKIKLHLSF